MVISDLGMIEFTKAYALQERLSAEVAAGAADETLLLLEHPPVYTTGSGGRTENILDPDIRVIRTNRGGDVTWHGPGQLVGYPVIDLARRGRDLHRYLRFLEELLIALAVGFGVSASRVAGLTGVWTEQGKLASIGVGVRRWVTMHGFSFNVMPDLSPFNSINPCGIRACSVASLAGICGAPPSIAEVKERLAERFEPLLADRLPVVEKRTLKMNISGCNRMQY
ncbi:MAG: lipoyl(octanoyl) transferase LipB [Geobacteraceae bacterium]